MGHGRGPFDLYRGNPHNSKTTSLYWASPLLLQCRPKHPGISGRLQMHWNRNVFIPTKFSSLSAPLEVVVSTTSGAVSDKNSRPDNDISFLVSGAASDGNLTLMTTFPYQSLTHPTLVPHICVSDLGPTISSGNGLSPDRRQAIDWTSAGIFFRLLVTNFYEIRIKIQSFHSRKCVWKYGCTMAVILRWVN